MIKTNIYILLLLLSMTAYRTALATELNILSWNIYMLPKPIKFTKQLKRANQIVKTLKNENYDLIVLQEVFSSKVRKMLAGGLSEKYPYQFKKFKDRKLYHIMSSGIYVASKYPITLLDSIYFKKCSGADCLASKGAFLFELTIDESTKVQFVATHMQAMNKPAAIRARKSQLAQIKKLLDKHYVAQTAQLLIGDINIDANISEEYPEALAYLEMQETPLSGDLTGTNGFPIPCYQASPPGADLEWLDHVWMRVNHSSAQITQNVVKPFSGFFKGEECSLSDHYGLEAKLSL